MARKKSKSESGGGRRAAAAAAAPVEVEEVSGGLTFEDGIVITTFLCLVGAIVLMVLAGQRYP